MELIEGIDSEEQSFIDFLDGIASQLSKTLPVPSANLKMVVIIPAKNEEEQIVNSLNSLAQQVSDEGEPLKSSEFEIIILCHNCSDSTKKKCEKFFDRENIQGFVLSLNSEEANTVGAARRILMNIACNRLAIKNGFIISTDADTLAHKHWLFSISNYFNSNIDMVCGIIASTLDGLQPQAMEYLRAKDEYLLLRAKLEDKLSPVPDDPSPRHNYHWGPNIAIKKQVYQKVGGLRPLHFLEDVDLFYRVREYGFSVRHCLKTKVTTSTRIDSRCSEGFGAELNVWTAIDGVPYNVEGLHKIILRNKIYSLAKKYFFKPLESIRQLLQQMAMISEDELMTMRQNSRNHNSMAIKMEQYLNKSRDWHEANPNEGVFDVCHQLNQYFHHSPDWEDSILNAPAPQGEQIFQNT